MKTLYQNPSLSAREGGEIRLEGGYNGYVKPDATVPPKAKPILSEISVNGVNIPEAEILAEAQHHPAANPGEALMAAARALAVRQLLLQEAQSLDIEADPKTAKDSRKETDEDVLIRKLIEQEVKTPSASETECRRFYGNNPARFCSKPIYEARHILLAIPAPEPSVRSKVRETAQSLIGHLRQHPQDFSALAAEHSACPSREQGGNLGQIAPGSTVAEFERALENMAEGELLNGPVESRFGFHIILLERKIAGAQLPFEQVRERIAEWLEASSWSKAVAQYITVLAEHSDIRGIDLPS